jgi:hypothetical protein
MQIPSPDAVGRRLDQLERENRRWRRLALGTWLAVAAIGLLGQSAAPPARPVGASRVIEGERFVLRDSAGRVGATLGWETDTPRLALHDPDGRPRAVLSVAAGGAPGLTLLDADGQTARAALVVGPDGAPGLALFDPAGKPRLAVALFHASGPAARSAGRREPTPAMVVYDATGVVRVTVGLRASEAAGLELADGRGGARALVSVKADGTPDLTMRDGDGRARATLGVLSDGAPALNLNGPDGRPRATVTLAPGKGAALALADQRGAVVWSAP